MSRRFLVSRHNSPGRKNVTSQSPKDEALKCPFLFQHSVQSEAENGCTDEDLMMWGSICINNCGKSPSFHVVMTIDSSQVSNVICSHYPGPPPVDCFWSVAIMFPFFFLVVNSGLACVENQKLSLQKDLSCWLCELTTESVTSSGYFLCYQWQKYLFFVSTHVTMLCVFHIILPA